MPPIPRPLVLDPKPGSRVFYCICRTQEDDRFMVYRATFASSGSMATASTIISSIAFIDNLPDRRTTRPPLHTSQITPTQALTMAQYRCPFCQKARRKRPFPTKGVSIPVKPPPPAIRSPKLSGKRRRSAFISGTCQPSQDVPSCPVSKLNDDCLMRVFDACGGDVLTLVDLGRVCRRWREVGMYAWLCSWLVGRIFTLEPLSDLSNI
ncbi:hypothetical protein BC938DRAFT_480759 [Jimgerdemannia flammicorona]|uniref:F-box domain-containing protein n=1 Tax=Jimgerdemannia flammicorona TaxID=994334 RepID=A0A433QHW6_9FUNG|nr:hypothetical protein BC938DRAFT_480759 [Jimgerdemannia flammicorona]